MGEEATIRGEVVRIRAERTARRRVDIVKVLVRDDTGAVEAVWFNQKYLTRVLAEGMKLSLRGTFRPQSGRQQFVVKGHEILEEEGGEGVHTEGVVPVYPASEQVSAKLLRALVHRLAPVMRRLPDPLPAHLLAREDLPGRADAVTAVHLPRTLAEARRARERLVLEELLLMQTGLLLHKREQQARVQAPALPAPGELAHAFLDGLPFELTSHQLAALDELEADLTTEAPMRRLLQGDVGSGKTVVALYCLVRAAEAGHQGVLLAPTETLAAQHAETAARLVGPLASTELVDGLADGPRAPRGRRPHRVRRDAHRHRHARAAPGGRASSRAWRCWWSTNSTGSGWSSATRWCGARSAAAARRTSCT